MDHLENLGFEYEGNEYEIGFDLDTVKEYANYSIAKRGQVKDSEFFKFALKKYSDVGFITNKVIEEIVGGLAANGLGDMDYEELVGYTIQLFIQAIDTSAKEVEPALVKINADSTVQVTVEGETYKLMFTRDIINEAVDNNAFDFNNLLEMYITGSSMIKIALQHYKKRFSVKLHDKIFLALWATKFNEETEDDLSEVLNAISFHMNDVIESGIKKSEAVIKIKKR